MKFSIKGFFSKCDQIRSYPQETADLITFTEETFNRKSFVQWSFSVEYMKTFYPEFTV